MSGKPTEAAGGRSERNDGTAQNGSPSRRKHRRLGTRRSCTFEHQGSRHRGRLLDLSLGGAFIESEFVPPEDDHVQIRLGSVRGRPELTFRGRVVHSGRYLEECRNFSAFGVQFVVMNEVLQGLIKVVSQRLCQAQAQRWAITLNQGPRTSE